MLYLVFLYAALASSDFRTRETAATRILELVDRRPHLYGPALAELADGCRQCDVRAAVRRPLDHWHNWRAAVWVPTTCTLFPICDAFPVWCEEEGRDLRNRSAIRCIRLPDYDPGTHAGPFWYAYRRTTELYCRGLIRDGVPAAEVDALLSRWWAIEVRDNHDCGPGPVFKTWLVTYSLFGYVMIREVEPPRFPTLAPLEWQGGYPR